MTGSKAGRQAMNTPIQLEFLAIKRQAKVEIRCGDSIDLLKEYPDNCIDALLCDPPAGIGFMGKSWDKDKGGRDKWIEWLSGMMREVLRVLKPGAHGLVWSLPKTSHWTAFALENAGFELREKIFHCFGSGFPKNHNISVGIDKRLGAPRDVTFQGVETGSHPDGNSYQRGLNTGFKPRTQTRSRTPEGKQWEGFGSAMKPAYEEWHLVRKPFKGTIAENVLKNGVGGLNIDGCRISHSEKCKMMKQQDPSTLHNPKLQQGGRHKDVLELKASGRWPANLILSHHPDCVLKGNKKVKGSSAERVQRTDDENGVNAYKLKRPVGTITPGYADKDGKEEVADWQCVESCPVRLMGEQSGERKSGSRNLIGHKKLQGNTSFGGADTKTYKGDRGTAARYFKQFQVEPEAPFRYCPKPSQREKNAGLSEEQRNKHPTVKSTKLMRYFAKLITPPGGTILDCFMGSGSTGVAAVMEEFGFVGFELERESYDTAKARINWACEQKGMLLPEQEDDEE